MKIKNIFKEKSIFPITVFAPVTGEVIPMEEVKDYVFSKNLIGKGVAIDPSGDNFYSPFKGKLNMVFPTGHAYGVEKNGVEILVHIGIDTVALKNKGVFTIYKKVGAEVDIDTKIIRADLNIIKELEKLKISPIIATNESLKKDNLDIEILKFSGKVKAGEPIFKIFKK